jgi:hypothetical protein
MVHYTNTGSNPPNYTQRESWIFFYSLLHKGSSTEQNCNPSQNELVLKQIFQSPQYFPKRSFLNEKRKSRERKEEGVGR